MDILKDTIIGNKINYDTFAEKKQIDEDLRYNMIHFQKQIN
jgi:hypothetical protein